MLPKFKIFIFHLIYNSFCIVVDYKPIYTTSVLGTAPLKMSTRAKTPISLFTCLHYNFLQVHFYNKHRAHTVPNRKRHLYLLFTTVFFLSLRSLSGPVIRASLCHGINHDQGFNIWLSGYECIQFLKKFPFFPFTGS